MKIFVSWSGTRSKLVAEFICKWIKQVLQGTNPWMSTDIEKGKSWGIEIHKVLSDSKFGIICLTKDNLESTWIHFEAGAIAKSAEGNVFTFLLDIDNEEVKQPLGQFQHTKFQKKDVLKLLSDINNILSRNSETSLEPGVLNEVFETNWKKFNREIKLIAELDLETEYVKRTPDDMIEEVLLKTRDLDMNLGRSIDWIINRLNTLNFPDYTAGSYGSYRGRNLFGSEYSSLYGSTLSRPYWNEHHLSSLTDALNPLGKEIKDEEE
jgi:hypothetical protein